MATRAWRLACPNWRHSRLDTLQPAGSRAVNERYAFDRRQNLALLYRLRRRAKSNLTPGSGPSFMLYG